MRKVAILGVALALSACAADQAIVTGFNGDSVDIQTSQFGGEAAAINAQKEANRLCQMRGFNSAEYASTRQDNYNYLNHNLYVCSKAKARRANSGQYLDQV